MNNCYFRCSIFTLTSSTRYLYISCIGSSLHSDSAHYSIKNTPLNNSIMNCLLFLSCLFAVCLAAASAQFSFPTSTGRPSLTTGRPGLTTGRPGLTTGRPAATTAGSALSCVCSCCSGLRCKPVALRTFADSTCTNKSCKEKCKVFEPTHCDHTFMGTNDAYCTVQF